MMLGNRAKQFLNSIDLWYLSLKEWKMQKNKGSSTKLQKAILFSMRKNMEETILFLKVN